jgi:outer membrane murein-binding lipoprotein Lpp
MKNSILLLAFTGAAMLSTFTSCGTSSSDKLDDAKEDVQDAEKDLAESRKELREANDAYQKEVGIYRLDIAKKIVVNNENIEKLKKMIETEPKDSRVKLEIRVVELEQKNKDLKVKMDNYEANQRDTWEDFKKEFNHDMDELGTALKDLGKKNVK